MDYPIVHLPTIKPAVQYCTLEEALAERLSAEVLDKKVVYELAQLNETHSKFEISIPCHFKENRVQGNMTTLDIYLSHSSVGASSQHFN